MRPDVFVRRRGRGAASTCFATGAADGGGAVGAACAIVTGADDGGDDGGAAAGTGVGEGFGGSDLATAFSPVLGGAAFTGVAGFGVVVDFGEVVVGVSDFGGVVALGGAAAGEDGCAATVFGVVDCGATAWG